MHFFTEPWCSPQRFKLPYSERKEPGNSRRKYLDTQHFIETFDVFHYSLSKGGIYCRPCATFASDEVGMVTLCKIVKTLLQKDTHFNRFLTVLSKQFNKDSLSRSNQFVALVKNNEGVCQQQANVRAAKKREKNRKILGRIIFFLLSFLGDWVFLNADTEIPVLCPCLNRVYST